MVDLPIASRAKRMIGEASASILLTQQKKSWPIIHEHCKGEKKRRELFLDHLSPLLHQKAVILDAGCGKGRGAPTDYNQHVKFAVGLDLRLEDLKQNYTVKSRVRADAHVFPFKDKAFDVVISQWCIEHMEYPPLFFQEVFRTLKPSGHFIFSTPNLYSYITFLSSLTSVRIHKFFNRILLRIDESDTFPTLYRANTIARLDKELGQCGFTRSLLTLYEEPPWLWTFSPAMCRLALRYRDIIMRSDRLRILCGIIFGVYQKNTESVLLY